MAKAAKARTGITDSRYLTHIHLAEVYNAGGVATATSPAFSFLFNNPRLPCGLFRYLRGLSKAFQGSNAQRIGLIFFHEKL